ncbi:MAG: hypothetical protein SPJ80_00160 [Bacilli bacterium]|nr:hypothetical protein [Bacilli bacterium]
MKERTPGKHTLLGTLIAIMAVVGSVSVGFSAWTFGNGGNASANGTFKADDVLGDYFQATIISKAQITNQGFVVDDTITNYGIFQLQYRLRDFQDLKNEGKTSLNLSFSLSYNASSFSDNFFTAERCSASKNSKSNTEMGPINNFSYGNVNNVYSVSGTISADITGKETLDGFYDFKVQGFTFSDTLVTQLSGLTFSLKTEASAK